MLKIELRKLAILALSFVMVGALAACSGSSSSSKKDQGLAALAYPASNVLGVYQIDVDPQAANVTITPVGSPYSSNQMTGDGSGNIPNVTVSTLPGTTWNGSDTIAFNAKVYWNDPTHDLQNVRIGVNESTNMNVQLNNYSKCVGQPWSSCLPGADPAVAYVADSDADGAVTERFCNVAGDTCAASGKVRIFPGCGSVTARWELQESGGAGYSFWANLYGDVYDVSDVTTDPRYSDNTTTVYLKTFKIDGSTSVYPGEAAESTSMAADEWFYIHYYVDASGASRPIPFTADYVEGPKRIEDTGNMAAWAGGTSSSANYWYLSYLLPGTIRWDPAIIEINASFTWDPPGNGALKFVTATGTKLRTIESGATVGWNAAADPNTALNTLACFKIATAGFACSSVLYPTPGNGARGLTGVTWDAFHISVHAKAGAVSGSGSEIKIAYDSNTITNAMLTNSTPYSSGDDPFVDIKRSLTWPSWCEKIPGGGCGGVFDGQYNMQNTYICIE